MSSAKVTIAQQDRSAIVSSMDGISVGTVVNSVWGPTEPYHVTSPTKFVDTYGKPDNNKGSSWNGAELLLGNSNDVWITRAIHDDARHSALLVAGTIENPDYNKYPGPKDKVDTIVKAIPGGLGMDEINSYSFPLYTRNREFINTSIKVLNTYTNATKIEVSRFEFGDEDDLDELGSGDFIAFGNAADDDSDIYEITSAKKVVIKEDTLELSKPITATTGTEIKRYEDPVIITSNIVTTPLVINNEYDFDIDVNLNGNESEKVYGHLSISNPDVVNSITWMDPETVEYVDVANKNFGEDKGFELDSSSLSFKVTFSKSGKCQLAVSLYSFNDNREITRLVYNISAASTGAGNIGDIVEEKRSGVVSYNPPVYLIDNATQASSIKVSDSDLLINVQDKITTDDGTTYTTVNSKDYLIRDSYQLELGTKVTVNDGDVVQYMAHGDTEQRDLFMVYAKYPGVYGDRIKIGIREDKNYNNAFYLDEYFDGVLIQSYEVSRKNQLDGFGYQMYIEEKINGTSSYIMVKNNRSIDEDLVPAPTTYGVWQRLPDDIFNETSIKTIEDVITNDEDIALSSVNGLKLGDRIKFGPNGQYEYKIAEFKSTHIILDRPVKESKFNLGTVIYKFNAELNDHENGIYNGVQYYKYIQISPLTNYKIGDQYTLNGVVGKILDAGYNNTAGGYDGSTITLYDVINAFKKMQNKEKYNISIFCDNGFAYPEVAIAIDEICQARNASHGFLSTEYASELKSDYTSAIIDYRNSTNLNSAFSSLFAGWIKATDTYNQTKVWIAPSVFGVNAQSFVTRNYNTYTPAAGWVQGVISGLDITCKFDEGERDQLVDAQVNPIRYREGYGLAIWGNETLYVKPSPFQLRSVAMLIILLKYGVENYLEYKLFQTNNEPVWEETETAINVYIRDNLAAGLYNWQVSVKDIITDSDIDNRRMPIFIGLQPTMDIQTIPVTLGIFNKSVDISY